MTSFGKHPDRTLRSLAEEAVAERAGRRRRPAPTTSIRSSSPTPSTASSPARSASAARSRCRTPDCSATRSSTSRTRARRARPPSTSRARRSPPAPPTSRSSSAPRSSHTPTRHAASPSSPAARTTSRPARRRTVKSTGPSSWTSTRRWRASTWSARARPTEDFAAVSVKSARPRCAQPEGPVPRPRDRRRGARQPRDRRPADAADVLADRRRRRRDRAGLRARPRAPRRRPRAGARDCRCVSGRDRRNGEPPAPERAAAARVRARPASSPADVDVVELHDAAAPGELIVSRSSGSPHPAAPSSCCAPAPPRSAAACRSTPAAGCSAGATRSARPACAQLVELTDQLRGRCGARQVDGARIALAENGGGYLENDAAVATVTILERCAR